MEYEGTSPGLTAANRGPAERGLDRQGELRRGATRRRGTSVRLAMAGAAEIGLMIEEVGDLVQLVGEADPDDKADLYTRLGQKLTYYPESNMWRPGSLRSPHMCERCESEGRAPPAAHGPPLYPAPCTAFTLPDVLSPSPAGAFIRGSAWMLFTPDRAPSLTCFACYEWPLG